MSIYEIEKAMLELQDPYTGELLDFEAFADLLMERETKIENMALWVKNLRSDAKALKDESANLKSRADAAEKKADSLCKYLANILNGETFKSTKAVVSFRKSASVEVDDEFMNWAMQQPDGDKYLKYKLPEVSKSAIKDALKAGETIPHARIVESSNISVK